MFHYLDTCTNTRGDSLANWQVEAVALDTDTVIPIYADETATPIANVSGVTNRAKTDANGNYDFFVADGTYSLKFYDQAGVYQSTLRYLSMYGSAPSVTVSAFTALGGAAVPADFSRIDTQAYGATIGIGAGSYVSDALATSALAAAHPRFCAQTANGRYFRLLPVNGEITMEQAGAVGDPTEAHAANDQPALAAISAYLYAVNDKQGSIIFSQRAYSIWMPLRTSGPRSAEHTADDGKALVLQTDQQLKLIGRFGGSRAKLNFRSYYNASFAGTTPNTNFQVFYDVGVAADAVWRGHGISIKTTDVDPGAGKRSALTVENLELNGGTTTTRSTSWPASVVDGSGWDITHKGIAVVPDNTYGGSVTILNSKVTGWRGETVYMGNNQGATLDSELSILTVRQSEFTESNGSCLNTNGNNVDVDGATLRNATIGIEGWTGNVGGRFVNTEIIDCYGSGGSTGGGLILQGGKPGASVRSAYYAPTRWQATTAPIGTLDIRIHNCAPSYLGWWLTGKIVAVDSAVTFGGGSLGDGCQETDIDLTCITDQTTVCYPRFGGYNSAGTYTVASINVRVRHERTAVAVAAARKATNGFDAYYSLGTNVNIDLTGVQHVTRAWGNSTTLHDYMPMVRGDLVKTGDVSGYNQNVETTPAVALRGPVISMTTTNTGVFTATLPTTNINTGQLVNFVNNNGGTGGIIRFNGSEASGSGVRGNGDLYLPGGRTMMMRFNGNYWEPVDRAIRKQRIEIPFIDQTGVLAVGTGKAFARMPFAATVVGVGAWVTTAQAAGAVLTFDIMETGTTILSTKLTFDNTEKTTTTAATAAVVSDSAIAADAEIRADITQVGTPAAIGGGIWLDVIAA